MAGLTKSSAKKAKASFGLVHVSFIVMLLGAIAIIVGLCVDTKFQAINWVTLAGGIAYLLGVLISIYVVVKVLITNKNKRSPQWKQAFINAFILGVMLVLDIVFIIYSIIG